MGRPRNQATSISVEVNHLQGGGDNLWVWQDCSNVQNMLTVYQHLWSCALWICSTRWNWTPIYTIWHVMKNEAKIIWKMALGRWWFLHHNMHLSTLLSLSTNFCLKQNGCHSTSALLTRFSAILTSLFPKIEDGVKEKKM